MMSTLQNHIKELNLKQLELIKRYQYLQKENDKLKKELSKQSIVLEDKQKTLEELKSQLDILKISKGLMSEEEKKELNRKINVYLKDIDKCLSLINT